MTAEENREVIIFVSLKVGKYDDILFSLDFTENISLALSVSMRMMAQRPLLVEKIKIESVKMEQNKIAACRNGLYHILIGKFITASRVEYYRSVADLINNLYGLLNMKLEMDMNFVHT